MGKRGPARTPKKELAKRGSWRADVRPDPPEPQAGEPLPPATFDADATQRWNWLIGQLRHMDILNQTDRDAMVLYCESYSIYEQARRMIEEEGIVTKGATGARIQHPAVRVRDSAWAQMYKMGQQFGLTPAARESVTPQNKDKKAKDGKAQFFNIAG